MTTVSDHLLDEGIEIGVFTLGDQIAHFVEPIVVGPGAQISPLIDVTGRLIGLRVVQPSGRVITRVMDDVVKTKDGAA